MEGGQAYPVQYSVDYPDRNLNRLSSALQASGCVAVAAAIGQPCPRITN